MACVNITLPAFKRLEAKFGFTVAEALSKQMGDIPTIEKAFKYIRDIKTDKTKDVIKYLESGPIYNEDILRNKLKGVIHKYKGYTIITTGLPETTLLNAEALTKMSDKVLSIKYPVLFANLKILNKIIEKYPDLLSYKPSKENTSFIVNINPKYLNSLQEEINEYSDLTENVDIEDDIEFYEEESIDYEANREYFEYDEPFAFVEGLKKTTPIKPEVDELFSKDLAQKIQDKLQKLYPEIKLNITNNPIWEQGDNIFNQEEYNNQVNYRLKTTEIVLNNLTKIKQWEANKSINQNTLWEKIGKLGIPKQQLELLKESNGNTIEEKLTNFIANYSYAVEINTAKEKLQDYEMVDVTGEGDFQLVEFIPDTKIVTIEDDEGNVIGVEEVLSEKGKKQIEERENRRKPTQLHSDLTVNEDFYINNPDWEYRIQQIITPNIIPSIQNHNFGTKEDANKIGWFRAWYNKKTGEVHVLEVQSDLFQKGRDKKDLISNDYDYTIDAKIKYQEEVVKSLIEQNASKETINIESKLLEVYKNQKETQEKFAKLSDNQFLQLLNKDNNWVTFFIKSIIQDSAKKGYEKVLFPTGETAAKIEGHQTMADEINTKNEVITQLKVNRDVQQQVLDNIDNDTENFISGKNKYFASINTVYTGIGNEAKLTVTSDGREEYNISTIKDKNWKLGSKEEFALIVKNHIKKEYATKVKDLNNRIEQLEKEIQELKSQGIEKLKPIEAFYEIKVGNILEKQFGKDNVKTITDEYGNQWREITINQARDLQDILLQKDEANRIIGQANIKAMTVLIDAVNQKQDTLPHEYAHHYIAWFRNTPIVQEAIKKWGSEEALVQSIGEQVVKQKGEAYNWWNNFVRWILNQFNKLSTLQKEELTQILTDAFLTRQDLNTTQFVKPGVTELFESNPDLANAVYEALGFNELNQVSTSKVIEEIITNPDFEELTPLAKIFKKRNVIDETKIILGHLKNAGGYGWTTSFIEDGKMASNVLVFNKEYYKNLKEDSFDKQFFTNASFQETVLHEELHRYTSYLIHAFEYYEKQGVNAYEKIDEIFEGKNTEERKFLEEYNRLHEVYKQNGGQYNKQEFITFGLTSKEEIDKLKKIKVDIKDSLLQRIIKALVNLVSTPNLYDSLLNSFENYYTSFDKSNYKLYTDTVKLDVEKPQITPQQKQEAQLAYSQYLNTTNNPTIQGFKEFVKEGNTKNIAQSQKQLNKSELKSVNLQLSLPFDQIVDGLEFLSPENKKDLKNGIDEGDVPLICDL